jgi:hypothetical protein
MKQILLILATLCVPAGASPAFVGAQHCCARFLFAASSAAQTSSYMPDWCKPLPRPEYRSLQRVLPNEPWFEVYKVSPGVFAIYEPHQSEETFRI